MRRLLLCAAATSMMLVGVQVQAQPSNSQTQYPPASNAQNSDLGASPNSLPRGGATGVTGAAGGALGGTAAPPPPTAAYSPEPSSGVNTLHPLRQPRHRAARRRRHVTHPAPASSSDASPLLAATSVG